MNKTYNTANMINENTRLIDLTAGDLFELLASYIRPPGQSVKPDFEHSDKYVYGVAGIARLLGVSKTVVYEYRKKGWIEPAIKQYGRKIVCDAPLAIELFSKQKEKTKTAPQYRHKGC